MRQNAQPVGWLSQRYERLQSTRRQPVLKTSSTNDAFPRFIHGPGQHGVYALSKLDGHLQKDEMRVVKELLSQEPFGELALCAFFLGENTGETVEEAYAFGLRRMADPRVEHNAQIKKRFVSSVSV